MYYYAGKELNDTLNQFTQEVTSVFNHRDDGFENEFRKQVNKIKLDEKYHNFIKELTENIREYHNTELIIEYINSCFADFLKWEGFGTVITDQLIVRNQFEASYLLKLKHAVEKYHIILLKWLELDIPDNGKKDFLQGRCKLIQKEIISMNLEKDPEWFDDDAKSYIEYEKMIKDNNIDHDFMIEGIKNEFMYKANTQEKIDLINYRLNKYKDVKNGTCDDVYEYGIWFNFYLKTHYPDFEKQCALVLEELYLTLEIEEEIKTRKQGIVSEKKIHLTYAWNATDTDLMELGIALLKAGIVRRTDGKKITHDEMTGLLENTFGCEIKDAKGKLSKAVARKKSVTPFLDSLKTAFEDYSRERDEN